MAAKAIHWFQISILGMILQGCNLLSNLSTCGELKSESTFDSHELMADQRTLLFTAHKRYFYSCEYCAVCTQRVESLGRWVIGTYDVYSNRVIILQRFQNGDRQNQGWGIQSVAGSKALINGDPYYFLDLSSNQLIPLALNTKFTQKGFIREEATPTSQLLTEEGTILLTLAVVKKLTLNTSESEYWVRYTDGNYKRLGVGARAIHQADALYLWSYETRQPIAYSLKKRTFFPITDQQYQALQLQKEPPKPNIYIPHEMHPSSRLHLGRRHGNEWKYELLPIEAENLKW